MKINAIALCFKLANSLPSERHNQLNSYSPETLARMLAVLYSCVFLEQTESFTHADEARIFDHADEVMGMLISKLDTSGEPF